MTNTSSGTATVSEDRQAQIWDDAIECAAAVAETHDQLGVADAIRRLASDATPKSGAAEGESRNSSKTCRENGNG